MLFAVADTVVNLSLSCAHAGTPSPSLLQSSTVLSAQTPSAQARLLQPQIPARRPSTAVTQSQQRSSSLLVSSYAAGAGHHASPTNSLRSPIAHQRVRSLSTAASPTVASRTPILTTRTMARSNHRGDSGDYSTGKPDGDSGRTSRLSPEDSSSRSSSRASPVYLMRPPSAHASEGHRYA